MTNLERNRFSLSGVAAAAAALLLALFGGLLATAAPAAAHDELTGSAPAAGQVLEAAPESVELSFSNVPAAIGSEVRILAEDGTDWAEGDVGILNTKATQKLRAGAPAGEYTVQWRVVSSDAHPIEGTFGFTVAGGSTETGTAQPTAAEPPAGESTEDPVLNQSDGGGFAWQVVVPAVIVLVAVATLISLLVRRRLRED